EPIQPELVALKDWSLSYRFAWRENGVQLEQKPRRFQQNVGGTAFQEQPNRSRTEISQHSEPVAEALRRNASDQAAALAAIFEAAISAERFRIAYRGSGRRGPRSSSGTRSGSLYSVARRHRASEP